MNKTPLCQYAAAASQLPCLGGVGAVDHSHSVEMVGGVFLHRHKWPISNLKSEQKLRLTVNVVSQTLVISDCRGWEAARSYTESLVLPPMPPHPPLLGLFHLSLKKKSDS